MAACLWISAIAEYEDSVFDESHIISVSLLKYAKCTRCIS